MRTYVRVLQTNNYNSSYKGEFYFLFCISFKLKSSVTVNTLNAHKKNIEAYFVYFDSCMKHISASNLLKKSKSGREKCFSTCLFIVSAMHNRLSPKTPKRGCFLLLTAGHIYECSIWRRKNEGRCEQTLNAANNFAFSKGSKQN